jgi:hypothetical protein
MKVLLDACVLFPTVQRELLIGAASADLFEPKWSARILEEWARAARKLGPEGEMIARGEVATLTVAWPRSAVPVHAGLEARLWLPDDNDIHVLAAAIHGSCDAILTVNAKDFPRGLLAEEGLERRDPDSFLWELLSHFPDQMVPIAEGVLAAAIRLSGQEWTYKTLMKKARLPRFGKALMAL